jgi:exodeoxyribonuclease VII large subunit
MDEKTPRFTVSDFVASTNQTLEYAYPTVEVEGEVSSFKLNQQKYVFFDIKDDKTSVGCFMMAFWLRVPIEDGMRVVVSATPKLTPWGKFSLTVKSVRPVGEGDIKKSLELLKAKFEKEGLFAQERKRALPSAPQHVGVISSTQAAGYGDFVKILNDRWGGVKVDVAHVQVQGSVAAEQITKAVEYFNQLEKLPEVLIIIRGGGSADDLAVFNDEPLARAIATSRVPTLVGVGHEMDNTIADMVADVRAATPTNAAQILVPDRRDIIRQVQGQVRQVVPVVVGQIDNLRQQTKDSLWTAFDRIEDKMDRFEDRLCSLNSVLAQLNPNSILKRGYSILRGETEVGSDIEIETYKNIIKAEVKNVNKK